jgi:tol-pal system protein YbgF
MNTKLLRSLCLVPLLMSAAVAVAEPAAPTKAATTPAPATANKNVLELLQKLDQLEKELRQLRGQLEEMTHEMKGVKRRQRELYLDIDRRLRDLERRSTRPAAGSQPVTPPATGNKPATTGTRSGHRAPTEAERKAYEASFNLLRQGRYQESIKAFTAFLKKYPKGSYSDNAQYWLGEANYVSRRYKQALKEFDKVIKNFPNSLKVADAMLKSGFTWYELKQWDKARSMLQAVVKRFQGSAAAQLASTRLERMSKEGH